MRPTCHGSPSNTAAKVPAGRPPGRVPIYWKPPLANKRQERNMSGRPPRRTLPMNTPPARQRHFASDNYAGICPEAWAAMAEANRGHVPAYGEDPWTERAADLIRRTFETDCDVFFVFNGTSANSLSLSHLCQSYHSILCHETAHVETDECGAPEFFSNGTKVLLLGGADGKIDPGSIERAVHKRKDIHYPKPRVLTLTQATELGTVYTPAEVRRVTEAAKGLGLRVHMDGARFANAVASRSEERRVGKGCKAGWRPEQAKENSSQR